MQKNNAGGYVFKADRWTRLERFLTTGSEAGSYYVTPEKLTKRNTTNLLKLIKEDGAGVIALIENMVRGRRVPRMDPAVFSLAMCAVEGNDGTQIAALTASHDVCYTPTLFFQFVADVLHLGSGWSQKLKACVQRYYLREDIDRVAFQMVKYGSRGGWSHGDMIKLSHPKPENPTRDALFGWAVHGKDFFNGKRRVIRRKFKDGSEDTREYPPLDMADLPEIVLAMEEVKATDNEKRIIQLVDEHRMSWEMVPSEKRSDTVWKALIPKMPIMALTRNLGQLTKRGIVAPLSEYEDIIIQKLLSPGRYSPHPVQWLMAKTVYDQGHGLRGSLKWTPSQRVSDALEQGLYDSFGYIEASGKRILLALDVSGSMYGAAAITAGVRKVKTQWGVEEVPNSHFDCMVADALMAQLIRRVEDKVHVVAFEDHMTRANIPATWTIEQTNRYLHKIGGGATNCSAPVQWAIDNNVVADAVIIVTDGETWRGAHPFQMMTKYRDKIGLPVKFVSIAAAATKYTIADPDDFLAMDISGFDSAAVGLATDFISQEANDDSERVE
jgi:60 kDa SS-A/Ro ribonucleoprotein